MQAKIIVENKSGVIQTHRMAQQPDEFPVSVRMPGDLKKEVERIAAAEQRSVNKTIILLLRLGIERYNGGGGDLLGRSDPPLPTGRATTDTGKAQKKRAS